MTEAKDKRVQLREERRPVATAEWNALLAIRP